MKEMTLEELARRVEEDLKRNDHRTYQEEMDDLERELFGQTLRGDE